VGRCLTLRATGSLRKVTRRLVRLGARRWRSACWPPAYHDRHGISSADRSTTSAARPHTTTVRRRRPPRPRPSSRLDTATAAPGINATSHHREPDGTRSPSPVSRRTGPLRAARGSEDHQRAAPASPPRRLDRCAARGAILIGAFNGGFKCRAAGAWRSSVSADTTRERAGQPRHRPGRLAHIGIWGSIPVRRAVASVRQTSPLVVNGRPAVDQRHRGLGATLGGGSAVARSALVSTPGNLLYAAPCRRSRRPGECPHRRGAVTAWSSTSILLVQWTPRHPGALVPAYPPAAAATILGRLDRTS